MQIQVHDSVLTLVQGDITEQHVDAIVNAANSGLRGGGGVDGAIHRAGGPDIMAECRRIGGCPTGDAVLTSAGRLKARRVIHAVGPVYRGGEQGEPELLARAYRRCLEVAAANGLQSIAFPSLSTGAYGYPITEASRIALETTMEYLRAHTDVRQVRFVLFDKAAFDTFEDTLRRLA